MISEMDFRYCPRCSGRFQKKKENLLLCGKCHFHLYVNPRVTNGIILENENEEILLVKRKYPPKRDYWDIPGGFLDFKETIEESMSREMKEELGLQFHAFKYFHSYYGTYTFQGLRYHTLCIMFIGKIKHVTRLEPTDDVSEVRFFKWNRVPFSRLAFVEVRKGIKDYLLSFHQAVRSERAKNQR
ncbi:NUDIX domain-containing protein [Candidatus Roizmanbacteria bacterium]|nr:NUDIX domain-containing protein [Candidatus Roizmanbacteria bacterium]